MLRLNLQRVCADKGIGAPRKFLIKNGFSSFIAHKLLNGSQPHFQYKHMEKLCLLLRCTPDALLDWVPEKDASLAVDHPLQKLRAKKDEASIMAQLNELSPEGIEKVRGFLKEMQGSGG